MTTLSLFTNRATAKLAADVSSADTALTLVPGGGDWFPAPAAGQFFRLVLQKGTSQQDQREYMACTSRTGDVLTVTRAQEGTPAANFTVGDEVSLVATALTMTAMVQRVGQTLQGALEVEADPTAPLGIATKQFVESGKLPDVPDDGATYGRIFGAWLALGAAAALPVPIPIGMGGTGGISLSEAQTNLYIPTTSFDDLEPVTKKYGDRWIRPGNMTELVWAPNAGGGGAGIWINPADAASEAYPIPVAKGGTGATTAAQALINLGGTTVGIGVFTAATQLAGRQALGIDYTTAVFKLFDGTVAAPGLAWNSEPALGWFRPGASTISMAAQGQRLVDFGFSNPGTYLSVYAKAANNITQLALTNQQSSNAAYNFVALRQNADGTASLLTGHSTTPASRGTLSVDAPATIFLGSTKAIGVTVDNPGGWSVLGLNKTVNGVGNVVQGFTNNAARWAITLGDGTTESGGNVGSDFNIARYADTGAWIDTSLYIVRSTGLVGINGALSVAGILTTNQQNINGPVFTGGNVSVGGNFNVTGTTTLGGAAQLNGAIRIEGTSTLVGVVTTNTLNANNNIHGGSFDVAGAGSVGTTMWVGGIATFNSSVNMLGAAQVNSTFTCLAGGLFQAGYLEVYNPSGSAGTYTQFKWRNGLGQNKVMRLTVGDQLEVVNSANTAVISSLRDDGRLMLPYGIACHYGINQGDSGGTYNIAYDGSVSQARIYIDSTWVACAAPPSDVRLKDNIRDLVVADADFMRIRPVSFDWKVDELRKAPQHSYGFIAQHVLAEFPDIGAVSGSEERMYGLDDRPLLAMAINKIQDLINRIKQLETA